MNIANQGFPAFRADLNDALVALVSNNSGASAPATTFANQLWYDTTNNILKIRNEDNDAWISIATLDQSADSVSVLSAATVNAGALNATGNTVLGDASTDTLNVGNGGLVKDSNNQVGIGTATALLAGGSPTTRGLLSINGSTDSFVALGIGGVIKGYIGQTSNGLQLDSEGATTITAVTNGAERMRIDSSGNVGIGRTPDQRFQIASPTAVQSDMFVGSTRTLTFYADATQTIIDAPTSIPMIFRTNGTERMRISNNGFLFFDSNYGSAAIAYGCRVWINFNGTGSVSVRGSGNVSSLGDNGTGDYTINFATALPDTNYSISGMTTASVSTTINLYSSGGAGSSPTLKSTTQVRIVTEATDTNDTSIQIFR